MLFACSDKHREEVRRPVEEHHEKHEHRECFCNRAFAPGERMFVCRERICPRDDEDRFECRRIPNCPFPRRRRCCFCDIFR